MESLLTPYNVLDLTDEKGFFCGKVLADLGANVIKVEKPGGDPARNIGPFYHDTPDTIKSLHWFSYNTNKSGITLNIETKDGQEIFKRLAKTADFIIESFPPGHMNKLGLGYPVLSEINPRVIMVSITPFGQTGPFKDYKSSDIVLMAMGGLMYLCGDTDRAPLRFSVEQAYPLAGLQAAAGALIAHHYRELTGEGQLLDVSIQECVLWGAQLVIPYWDVGKDVLRRQGEKQPRGKFNSRVTWPCKDGYVCWRLFVAQLGHSTRALVDWMKEEGMAGKLEKVNWEDIDYNELTTEQMEDWERIIAEFFLKHTKAELEEELLKRGGMLFPMNNPKDLLENVQLTSRDFWVDVDHPELRTSLIYPGIPLKSDELRSKIRRAPLIGEHNEEVYGKTLGLSKEELLILKQSNII